MTVMMIEGRWVRLSFLPVLEEPGEPVEDTPSDDWDAAWESARAELEEWRRSTDEWGEM